VVCVGAVVRREDAILFVRQTRTHDLGAVWTIPWGALDAGEMPSAAAVRESREEAGIDVVVAGLLGMQALPEPWTDWLALIFLCDHAAGEPRPDGEETDAARYFTRRELCDSTEPFEPWCRWLVEHLLGTDMTALPLAGAHPFAPSEGFFPR
jgi:ADP-ribose pyrophosphatase YjhB (NUDIX family)